MRKAQRQPVRRLLDELEPVDPGDVLEQTTGMMSIIFAWAGSAVVGVIF